MSLNLRFWSTNSYCFTNGWANRIFSSFHLVAYSMSDEKQWIDGWTDEQSALLIPFVGTGREIHSYSLQVILNYSKNVKLLTSNWITTVIWTITKNVVKERLFLELNVWHLTWLHGPVSWEEVQKSILWKPRGMAGAGEREAQIPSCFISHSQFSSVIVHPQKEGQNYSAATRPRRGLKGVPYQYLMPPDTSDINIPSISL